MNSQSELPDRYSYFGDLSGRQESFLIGTLLGDGHLQAGNGQKNPRLQLRQCLRQRDWLIYKAAQFGPLFKTLIPRENVRKDGVDCALDSRCHPCLLPYHTLFYSRHPDQVGSGVLPKAVTTSILERVDDLTLAVWFCDDGGVMRHTGHRERWSDSLYIMAGGLGTTEYALIREWFYSQGFGTTMVYKPGGNRVAFNFHVEESKRLADRLRKFVPPSMGWKLGRC